jgi:hypothetical protein
MVDHRAVADAELRTRPRRQRNAGRPAEADVVALEDALSEVNSGPSARFRRTSMYCATGPAATDSQSVTL